MKILKILLCFIFIFGILLAQEEKKEKSKEPTKETQSIYKQEIQEKPSKKAQQIIMEELEIIGKIEKPQAMYIIPKAKIITPDIRPEESFLDKFNIPFEVIIE